MRKLDTQQQEIARGRLEAMTARDEVGKPWERLPDDLCAEVVANSRVAVAIVTGPDFVLRYVNEAYQALGPERAMLGRPHADVWPEAMEDIGPLLRAAMAGKPFVARDMRVDVRRSLAMEPERRYFSFSYSPFTYHDGPAVLISALETTDEVLARQAAERYAQDAERRSRELVQTLERIADGFFALDSEWRFTYVNPRAEEMLKRSREDLLGKNLWDEFPAAKSTAFYDTYHLALREQQPLEVEEYYEPLKLTARARVYPNPDGVSVLFVDLGEQRRHEAELEGLRERAESLARYLEASSQPFAAGTPDGALNMVNHAFVELVGYSEDELLHQPEVWSEKLTPPEWREPEAEVVRRLIETGMPQRYEKEYVRKDGRRVPIELLLHVVKDPSGAPASFYSFVTDVTQRRHSERLKEALNQIDSMLHSTLEFDEVVERAIMSASQVLEADSGTVVEYDDDDSATIRYWYPSETGAEMIGTRFTLDQTPFTRAIREERDPLVSGDMEHDPRFNPEFVRAQGLRAFLAIPLIVRDEVPAGIGIGFRQTHEFVADDVDFLRKLAGSISLALENARLYEERTKALAELEVSDLAIRQAYSDVIDAATGGRLILLGPDELDSALRPNIVYSAAIDTSAQFSEERHRILEVLKDVPGVSDLVLAFGEAITNALKHAGPATYEIRRDEGRVQIVVSDEGPGIDFGRLPKATLVPGFSTKQTLGMGFTLMLELSDRLILCTGPGGTVVVIERLLAPVDDGDLGGLWSESKFEMEAAHRAVD